MGWYSILPSRLETYESWAIKTFIFLALLNASPWLLAIFYDLSLYAIRTAAYECPYIGGRAHGAARPHAPSLKNKKRSASLVQMVTSSAHVPPGRPADLANHLDNKVDKDLANESVHQTI